MTAKPRGKGKIKKLKLKKETLKDLDVNRTAKKVKGGVIIELSRMPTCVACTLDSCACTIGCTHTCLYTCPCLK
ncbi:MAG TPA: hypothetical protein VF376_10825 [Thermoanaerobaculia bacterium]